MDSHDDFGSSMLGITFESRRRTRGDAAPCAVPGSIPWAPRYLRPCISEKYLIDYTGAITYYAFAEDNYPPKPHRVVSEPRFIDILPFKQDYQLGERKERRLMQRSNSSRSKRVDRASSEKTSIAHSHSSEKLLVDDAVAGRLAKYEGELHAATAEFAGGSSPRSPEPIPALEEAVTAMQSAATSLEAKDLSAARPGMEEAALKGLISAARQNLRKKLNQNSSNGQAKPPACKFDRQQAPETPQVLPADQDQNNNLLPLDKDLREPCGSARSRSSLRKSSPKAAADR